MELAVVDLILAILGFTAPVLVVVLLAVAFNRRLAGSCGGIGADGKCGRCGRGAEEVERMRSATAGEERCP